MKTEQLIDMLSTNVEPVNRSQLGRTLAWAVAIGGVAAFCVMLATVGLRPDFGSRANLGYLILKLLFTLSLIGIGGTFLIRAMLPGRDARRPFALAFLPLIAAGVAGMAALVLARPAAWGSMILETQWAGALICIPLFAIIPFAVLIWALRKGAPTNLKRTGAIAGLVAGALGGSAYAFNCPHDSLPFIAIWYGTAIALCTVIGAILGPRLLRW
jgi:hypothetical protein